MNHWQWPKFGLALPTNYKTSRDKLGTRYEKGYVTGAMTDVKNLRAYDVAFELYYSLKSMSQMN